MNKHYFFKLNSSELKILKEEYLYTTVSLFSKKYKIWCKALINLFWKKWRKWICWRYKIINIKTNKNKFEIINPFDNEFFNDWLYKKSNDHYYFKLIDKSN